ncbi:hypothetical protein RclHR1_02140022 [Rhizophagus clarus]|uniref:Uncharacterized protein n=1 Tax=Rhizophagus clarus TaxID=94130 RepID=A0A2Z6R5Z5_9GLOM|nr:hypothetical protein RclHR1_02140022 [Rhizophagus clarus]GES84964.1 hypothetical protein GLOIN_2v1782521 [Rhizophagus clarus]
MSSESKFKKLPEIIQILTLVFTRKIIYNDHFNPEPISQENKKLCEEFITEYLLNGKTQKYVILEARLKNKSKNEELIPVFIEHAKTYYEDREILFGKKHELIPFIFHYFRQRENEISNNQTLEDCLKIWLAEIENMIGLKKLGDLKKRLNRIKEFLIKEKISKGNKKKIWVKFNENAIKITFSGDDVFDLIEEATTKLNGLDNFKIDLIEAYKHNAVKPLKFSDKIDGSFANQYETPIMIKVKAPM